MNKELNIDSGVIYLADPTTNLLRKGVVRELTDLHVKIAYEQPITGGPSMNSVDWFNLERVQEVL